MRFQSLVFGIAALAASLGPAPTAQAEVHIRAPFVSVDVGRPGVQVGVFGRPLVVVPNDPYAPAPRMKAARRKKTVLPPPRLVPSDEEALPTLAEFVETFQPRAGKHEVVLLHPVTEEPVFIRFTLPAGRPQRVRLQGRELEFDYGDREVDIRFLRDGRVRVLYD